jgi:hypothetical protein
MKAAEKILEKGGAVEGLEGWRRIRCYDGLEQSEPEA